MAFQKWLADKGQSLMEAKNADYSGAIDGVIDVFRNFRKHGVFGIQVRLDDKHSRIETFLKRGTFEVKSENFIDTVIDACNYLILMAAMLVEEGQLEVPEFFKEANGN